MDNINAISLFIDETPVPLVPENPFQLEHEYHFLKINMAQPMLIGMNYTLIINYDSTMNEGPMKRGIWRGWYIDENNVERYSFSILGNHENEYQVDNMGLFIASQCWFQGLRNYTFPTLQCKTGIPLLG